MCFVFLFIESKQVNAISILESEVADALAESKDGKTGKPCYENKSPLGANVTQRKKRASSLYLKCQTIAVDFETDICSNRFSRWATGPRSPVRQTNGREASTFSWLFDPHCDSNSNTSLLEDAMLSGQLPGEIVGSKNRSLSTNGQDRSVTTLTEDQNKITSSADKDVASPLRFENCVFTEQEVQDTAGIYPIENSDNNRKKQSQSLRTLSPVAQTSSKLALISSVFPMEMDSLGENPTPTSSRPPEDQLYQVSDRIRKCRQTYSRSEVCSDSQEKIALPPSEKRRKTFSEKQIEVENQSPNCDPTCGRSGVKRSSQKNKVTDKQMFSNEINKEIKQIRNRMSTDLLNTPSKVNDYREKNRKESEKVVINMDQQIPNTISQAPQCLPCVRTLSVEIPQKMTDKPLKQEVSRRTHGTKASDCRKENMIPLECNLKHDSQEHILRHETKGRQVKQNKNQPRKACSQKSKMETSNSDNKQSSVKDSPSRKKQALKSHVGNSRIPILASCSMEPGLNNIRHASVKSMEDIQNNVNKKQTPSTVQINATRNVLRSMTKAKQKVENVLSAKDQSDFGKKVVSGTVSGEHESTEVGQVMQDEGSDSLSKAERNFSQRVTKKLVLNSSGSLEPSYVISSPEQPVRTSAVAAFQLLEPHVVNGRVLTALLLSQRVAKSPKEGTPLLAKKIAGVWQFFLEAL
ncbi:uncharacterized protein LOC110223285 [Phascolarctos cinereus]